MCLDRTQNYERKFRKNYLQTELIWLKGNTFNKCWISARTMCLKSVNFFSFQVSLLNILVGNVGLKKSHFYNSGTRTAKLQSAWVVDRFWRVLADRRPASYDVDVHSNCRELMIKHNRPRAVVQLKETSYDWRWRWRRVEWARQSAGI